MVGTWRSIDSFKEIVQFKIVPLKVAFRSPTLLKGLCGEAVDVSRTLRAVEGYAEEAGARQTVL